MSRINVYNYETSNKLEKSYSDIISMGEKSDVIENISRESICKPMTVDDLYEEILFIMLSNTTEDDFKDTSDELLDYIQKVFQIPRTKHLELLKDVKTKKPPQKTLSIEVDRAENLSAMDSNGLSDPFVTVYIESNFTNRYNTAVMQSTLNPTWKEHFLIPIQANPTTEMLTIEVWDFDAAESVGEKMNKFVGVKGIRGFKKLLKEIALTASTGKHDNELIGKTNIPLKSIPATGVKSWYTLRKGSSNKNRGSILLHLHFSIQKPKVLAINEHLNLLRIFLLYELKLENVASFKWCGKFNNKAHEIITQHSMQSNLSEIDCAFCQWETFTKIHEKLFLSLKLFNLLSEKLLPEVQALVESDKRVNQFWEGYRRILPSCFVILRSIRYKKFDEAYGVDNLSAALEIIKKAQPPAVPDSFDIFPQSIYGWLDKMKDCKKITGEIALGECLKLSALQFLNKVCDRSRELSENSLDHLIYVMRSLIHDIQMAVQFYDKHFYSKSNIKYAALLYNLYQEVVTEMFFPKIIESCRNLNRLNILDEEITDISNTAGFESGTLLFDLYLGFKKFTNLGAAVCLPEDNVIKNKFYEYFYPAVANWLNISVIKTLIRIEKAIELDEFLSYNNGSKYSSSALDTLSIFYQIKYFWEQLDWPIIEESYLFLEKIINDLCRCCTFYANKLSLRLHKLDKLKGEECFKQRSKELCYAINDINYVKESLPLFLKELKVEDVINKLAKSRSDMEAERCSLTINNIICNTVDIVENKMFDLIEMVAEAFLPVIENIFEESYRYNPYESPQQMDPSLKSFHKSIEEFQNELQDYNASKLSDVICNKLILLIKELIGRGLKKFQQPSYFANMLRILMIILEILNYENDAACGSQNLKEIRESLSLYAMDTGRIIHKYYANQLEIQTTSSQNQYGQLTVKAYFSNDSLHVHILNAYQLTPTESDSSCTSYVKVHFSPIEEFIGVQNLRTSVQHRTRFPLYDEHFSIKLTPQQRENEKNILIFCVKNKDLFGLSNFYIAECYLSFEDIKKAHNKQIRINLNKPKYSDAEIIRILVSRPADKQAKEFLRKLKHKSSN